MVRLVTFQAPPCPTVIEAAYEAAEHGLTIPAGVLARAALVKHAKNLCIWHGRVDSKPPRSPRAMLDRLMRGHIIDVDTRDRLKRMLNIGFRCSINEPVHFADVWELLGEARTFIETHPLDEDALRAILNLLREVDGKTDLFDDDEDGEAWKGGGCDE